VSAASFRITRCKTTASAPNAVVASGLVASLAPSSTLDIEMTRGPVKTPATDSVLSRRSD
jgi:hypothetical protein